jgi:putative Holliday junction resolvase
MTIIPRNGRILALDWGVRRFGVARCDETQTLASPLETLVRREGKRFPMPRFLEIVAEAEAVGIIVGLPLGLDGSEQENAAAARQLAELVAKRTELPVEMVDERFTTVAALDAIQEVGGSTRGRKEDVDALAASILLQGFLDGRRAARDA